MQLIDSGSEHQLCARAFKPDNTIIDIGDDVIFGTDKTVLMAGPCSVESEQQVMRAAAFLREKLNIKVFRAGAFKPRTSPYTFQGLTSKGLELLAKVRERFGMKIITEVKDSTHLDEVADVADIIQIGTKSMYIFTMLQRCGQLDKPILLKRGFMATIKEFLQAADFIMANGNPNVILCERGIRTFEPMTRFSMDICAAALVKELSHLPLVLDPSHAMGLAAQVPDVTNASAALGVDGLLVEVHPDPSVAKSDKDQQLDFDEFTRLVKSARNVCQAVGRNLI